MNITQHLETKLSLNLFALLSQDIELLQEQTQELEQELNLELRLNPFLKLKSLKVPRKFFVNKEDYTQNISASYTYKEFLIKSINEELDDIEKDIAKEIVYSLDSNGFISQEALEQIKDYFKVDYGIIEDMRTFIMGIEPVGHGSLDVFEYMELQIRTYHKDKKDYIKYLKDPKHIPKEVLEFLKSLKKTPVNIDKTHMLPSKVDAYVEIDNNEIYYDIYDDYIELELEKTSVGDKELEQYLKQRARRYVEAINLRKKFLKAIVDTVVNTQKYFFLKDTPLKTLMLKDVANEFGVSISTISRLINAKYLKSPKGVFKFRTFFVREAKSNISQEELMNIIRKIINNEETIYTDADIKEILSNYGINISRRTVAKYRQKLGIQSSWKR